MTDFDTLVVDTNIIDARILTELVADGSLYGATIVIPDIVLEEVHRQVEHDKSHDEQGLKELVELRELTNAKILDLEIEATAVGIDSTDNVAVDHAILQIARQRDAPLCSDDKALLKLAKVAGVTTYRLKQTIAVSEELVEEIARNADKIPLAELIRQVYERTEGSRFTPTSVVRSVFNSPDRTPAEDVAAEREIREVIDRLVRHNVLAYENGVVEWDKDDPN